MSWCVHLCVYRGAVSAQHMCDRPCQAPTRLVCVLILGDLRVDPSIQRTHSREIFGGMGVGSVGYSRSFLQRKESAQRAHAAFDCNGALVKLRGVTEAAVITLALPGRSAWRARRALARHMPPASSRTPNLPHITRHAVVRCRVVVGTPSDVV